MRGRNPQRVRPGPALVGVGDVGRPDALGRRDAREHVEDDYRQTVR